MTKPVLKNKKILIAWSSFQLGGAERQMIRLGRWLKNEQQAEVFFWGIWGGPWLKKLAAEGFDVKALYPTQKLSWRWRGWRKLGLLDQRMMQLAKRDLQKIKPAVILAILRDQNIYFGNLWPQVSGIKGMVWNQADLGLGQADPELEKKAINQASAIVSNSRGGADYLIEKFNLAPDRVQVIPNFVEYPPVTKTVDQIYREFDLPTTRPIVTMVANLSKFKDHPTLLMAWQQVINFFETKNQIRPLLVLAGRDDNQELFLKKIIAEQNLTNKVVFLGAINNVPELLAISQVGVLASNSEGSSNSVAEYMLAGLPVVGARIPANLELLGNKYDYYYQPRDPDSLATKLIELLSDVKLSQRVGRQNQRRAAKFFDNDRHYRQYLKIITDILTN